MTTQSQNNVEELEASGDAIVIADAIHTLAKSFTALADSIASLAVATQAGEETPPPRTYMDGTRIL